MGLTARYRSVCPACGRWAEVGNTLERHPDLPGAWVHDGCAGTALSPDRVARWEKLLPLGSGMRRKVVMALGGTVTRDGRYRDTSEVTHDALSLGTAAKFDGAVMAATGKGDPKAVKETHSAGIDPVEVAAAVEKEVERRIATVLETIEAKAVAAAVAETRTVVAQYRPVEIRDAVGTQRPTKWTLPPQFERMLQLASQRVHILMVGPSGCGKTFLAERLAEAIRTKAHPKGLPYAGISCSTGMSEAQLAGYLLPSGKGGMFEYWASLFVERYVNGGLFLFDEIDASDGNTMTFMNAALANTKMFVAQRLQGQIIERHPDFVCVAAANTYGLGADDMYVGRNQLDAATLRRFSIGTVKLDYDPTVEEAIVDPEVLTFGRKVRSSIRQHGLRRFMSTAEMLEASKMKAAYKWDVKQCFEGYFSSWSSDELARAGELN